MTQTQATWADFTGKAADAPEPATEVAAEQSHTAEEERPENAKERPRIEPDERYRDLPDCPWCWGPSAAFHEVPMGVGCRICDALIPIEAEWFLDGHKIGLSRVHQPNNRYWKQRVEKWIAEHMPELEA